MNASCVIDRAVSQDIPRLLAVWESSVRATHDFLSEPDIRVLRPIVLCHVPLLTVWCARVDGQVWGFAAVNEQRLEMLFVHGQMRGQGLGCCLLRHVLEHEQVCEVDVNEQNPAALGFYQHMGFTISGRSPVDGQGRPFPLLHLRRAAAAV